MRFDTHGSHFRNFGLFARTMFIKKDTRKIPEILADEGDPRTHLKLARRGAEFADGVKSVLCAERHLPRLQSLQVLSLYGNQLRAVDGIGTLSGTPVEEINLGQNLLEGLPEDFGAVKTLQLWIDGNKIGPQMPSCVLRSQLRAVLRTTTLRLCEDLGDRLPLLEVLAFDNNALEGLPASVYKLAHLEKLIIRGNKIEEISEDVGQLTELRMIQAASNRLRLIPEALGGLTRLEELYLNSNQIAEVPASLIGLVSVKKISLANNRISALPQVEEKWNLDGAPANSPADAVSR